MNAYEHKRELCNEIESYSRQDIIKLINWINKNIPYEEFRYTLEATGNKHAMACLLRFDPDLKISTIEKAFLSVMKDKNFIEQLRSRTKKRTQKNRPKIQGRVINKATSLNTKIKQVKGFEAFGSLITPEDLQKTRFDQNALNLDMPLDVLIKRPVNFYRLRDKEKYNIKNYTLLFYGPPGTGKTNIVTHLSNVTGQMVLKTSVSHILGSYVSESERNLRKLFEFAQKNNLILFIDEIEGMISSREGASNSWEVTLVNEFLVQMESFKGIFIAATNLYENVDSAFLRRFSDKLKFGYIKEENLKDVILNKFSPILKSNEFSKSANELLSKLHSIAPGDLESVYKRIVLDDRKYTVLELLTEIKTELVAKNHTLKNRIGVTMS